MAPRRGAVRQFARRLKWHAAVIFAVFFAGMSVTWTYYEEIFRFLYRPANGNLTPYGIPIYTSPVEAMDEVFSLAFKGGLVVAFPVFMFSLYRLVFAPLMKKAGWPRSRRLFFTSFLFVMGLFYLGGVAFTYYVMLPVGLKFLLSFGNNIAVPMITISAYMSLVTALMFWLGIVFEIPLAMFLLAKVRLVSRKRMGKLQIYVPIFALFMGGIITPTGDPLNQFLVAGPIVGLYEVGLFLAFLAEGGPRRLWHKVRAGLGWLVQRPGVICKATWQKVRFWRD